MEAPDFWDNAEISQKKMKELKEGNCFPNMGCVDGKELITYKIKDNLYVESFERMYLHILFAR